MTSGREAEPSATVDGLVERSLQLLEAGHVALADAPFRAMLALDPGPSVLFRVGQAFEAAAGLGQAAEAYREAIRRYGPSRDVVLNYAFLLNRLGRDAHPALAAHLRGLHAWLAGDPANASLRYMRGVALTGAGHLAAALGDLERVAAAAPGDAAVRLALAEALLQACDYERGFAEIDFRWQNSGHRRSELPFPEWRGEPCAGQTILVLPEQGYGDIIQYVRYAPQLKAWGARVLVTAPDPLIPLLETLPGIDRAVPVAELHRAGIDRYVPMFSLLKHLGVRYDAIPSGPYLQVPGSRAERWRGLLGALPRPRVAIAWAGSPGYPNNAARSLATAAFARILHEANIQFVNLQLGPQRDELQALPEGARIFDATALPHDFADMAAVVAQCDLTVTVDTAFAHLAGALGCPVWVLLGNHGEWRWSQQPVRTPWYRTMRLIRQRRPGDWSSVVEAARAGLRGLGETGRIPELSELLAQ